MNPTSSSTRLVALTAVYCLSIAIGCDNAAPPPSSSETTNQPAPATPPPEGDELGMARELGPTTWGRCAAYLSDPGAKAYELSYVRTNTMPLSPFAGPFEMTYLPPAGIPGLTQTYNVDVLNENVMNGQQSTQIDALGHFGRLEEAWDGTSEVPVDGARYYGGFTQEDVKPTPDSPLLKLGMEKVPPIITTAVLLDARTYVNGGEPMSAGQLVTPEHIEHMLEAQGLQERGILPGDVVLIYTGWSEHYQDPDIDHVYYSMAPGLSYEAAQYLGERRIVAAGVDAPFVDAVTEGELAGEAGPPEGTPPGKAFPVHEYFLTEAGIHNLEGLKLDELARDRVTTSCVMILPLREKGSSGSPIRPVAVGVPGR